MSELNTARLQRIASRLPRDGRAYRALMTLEYLQELASQQNLSLRDINTITRTAELVVENHKNLN